jgi:hypothetical protein
VKVIDRLAKYLEIKNISPRAFELSCGVANGYLGKQLRVKGSVGSDILEKVSVEYPDLNLVWLITGQGKMIVKPTKGKQDTETENMELQDEKAVYQIRDHLIEVLKEQLETLSATGKRKYKKRKKS